MPAECQSFIDLRANHICIKKLEKKSPKFERVNNKITRKNSQTHAKSSKWAAEERRRICHILSLLGNLNLLTGSINGYIPSLILLLLNFSLQKTVIQDELCPRKR